VDRDIVRGSLDKSLRVIISGTPLLGQLTGIGHYTRQLVTALQTYNLLEELKLWGDVSFIDPAAVLLPNLPESGVEPPQKVTLVKGLKRAVRATASRSYSASRAYALLTEQVATQRLGPYASTHLYHSPNFVLPRYEGPTVVTIHDLSVLRFPQFHRRQMVEICERGIVRAVEEGAHLIADAEVVRQEIMAQFAVPEHRVTAVHLAPDARCRPRSVDDCRGVLEAFGLAYRGFFLCVGTIEPRKNLLRIVEAYRAGRQEGLFNWPLVIVGAPGWKSVDEHRAIETLCADGMAMYLRYLDDAKLHQLYAATGLLVFPSLYEGFGLPAIEAQASGSRVLTSRGSAMEEFVGPSALLVDPLDTESIKNGLHEAFDNSSVAAEPDLVSRNWQEVAAETVAVYRKSLLAPIPK